MHDALRRRWTLVVVAVGVSLGAARAGVCAAEGPPSPWWYHYPVYVGDIGGTVDVNAVARLSARMVSGNFAADPAWGPYGQRINAHDAARSFQSVKATGARWISWVEAFGDCMLYAGSLRRNVDGSYQGCANDPMLPLLARTAWSWEAGGARPEDVLRWVGLHNCVNNEDFLPATLHRETLGLAVPRYPDGREATGWLPDGQYPTNARLFDACAAKDINGRFPIGPGMLPTAANTLDPATGKPKGSTEGLYRVLLDRRIAPSFPGRKEGDTVYAASLCIPKDAAAPFWIDAIRVAVREILHRGVDGLWCDNFSPWDNFAQFDRAFGDWSEHRFRSFLAERLSPAARRAASIGDPDRFQVRDYLKRKAAEFGAKDSSDLLDTAWCSSRWLDDPVWNAFKVFKQRVGQETLRKFYNVIKDEARNAGRRDFLVAGNDNPIFGLGWTRDEYLDMVSSELSAGGYLTTGPRGVTLPPRGKSAVVYRAALEHQKAPYATIWYYLNGDYAKYQRQPELAKTLMAEAFAHGAFLKFGGTPEHPGTEDSVAWWNAFVTREEPRFGPRVAVADVGILYSPDNQLALLAPAGPPNIGYQPHSFGHWGFATAMLDAHVPYRVVVDWKLSQQSLAGLRTLVIPDAQWLDDRALDTLDAWVREGGRLVVTGPSGTRHGTAGLFAPRATSLLTPLVGVDMTASALQIREHRRTLDKGTVLWTSAPLGMQYYLELNRRESLVGRLVELVGAATQFDGQNLPATVGVSCWTSPDRRSMSVDLVNYDWNAQSDRIRATGPLQFRMRWAPSLNLFDVTTLSPDPSGPAGAVRNGLWIEVQLPKLVHFACVKLSAK